MLRDQSIGRIYGWKSTQCAKRAGEKFPSLPPDCAFVQILHVGGNHWITTSNVDPLVQNAHYRDAVAIYDSIFTLRVRASTKQTICQFLKPSCDTLYFEVINIQTQSNLSDCGLFSIACATELVYGCDPVLCNFDTSSMRSHLLTCFEEGLY